MAPKKIALIVAIGKYMPDGGWDDLSSAEDIKLITNALKTQGFADSNIALLRDKAATATGIQAAIKKHLVTKSKPGDIAVFHYSGHGQQVEDLNGDEGDGLDEALVPYDAPAEYKPGVQKHLTDDMLEASLRDVRLALGTTGNLLVVVDACHSGTVTRGKNGKVRGTDKVYSSKTGSSAANKKKTLTEDFGLAEKEASMSPMAAFFAASPFELNAEAVLPGDVGCGSLSLALSRALEKVGAQSSYASLFDEIKLQMSTLVPQQTPMAEGDLNYALFNGKALPKPAYFRVAAKGGVISLPVGTIGSIYEGTTVKLYPPETRDTTGVLPWAKGKITSAGIYSSMIVFEGAPTPDQLSRGWVYLHEISYGSLGVSVNVKGQNASGVAAINSILKNITQARKGAAGIAADLAILVSADSVLLIAKGGYALAGEGLQKALTSTFFSDKIGDYARASFIRGMALTNDALKVTFKIVPLKCVSGCGTPGAQYVDDPKTKRDTSGNLVLRYGDRFRLDVTNEGAQAAFYTIVDIWPNNVMKVLVPGANQQADEFRIFPGNTSSLSKIYVVGPPEGVDMVKIIASDEPIDLRGMVSTRGAQTRGQKGLSPFATLLQGTFNAEGRRTRGGDEATVQPNAVNIVSIPYKCAPPVQ